MRRRKDTERAAFTLIELLTVVGIMLMLASVTLIAVAPFIRGRSSGAAARVVQAAIYQARTYAATQGSNATVYFDPATRSFTLYASTYIHPDNRLDERATFLPPGIRFVVNAAGDPVVQASGTLSRRTLVFRPSGSLDPTQMGGLTSNWDVSICDERGENVKRIEVVFASGMTAIYEE